MTDPTTTAEHKRREEYDVMMRNLTATQTECTSLLQQKRELAESLNVAIRGRNEAEEALSNERRTNGMRHHGAEAKYSELLAETNRWEMACGRAREELAAESTKVGEQATEIDRLRNALNGEPKVGKRRKQLMRALGMPTAHASEHEPNWEALLEKVEALRATVEAKTETTVQCGAAEWLDCQVEWLGSRGQWSCWNETSTAGNRWVAIMGGHAGYHYGASPRLAREALARSLGWTGREKAPPSAQEAVGRVEAPAVEQADPEPARSVLGAFEGKESDSSVSTIAELRAKVEAWERWRPFIDAYASWRFDGTGYTIGGAKWRKMNEEWLGDCNLPDTLGCDDEPIPYRVTKKANGPANVWDQCADCRHKGNSDYEPPCDECAFSAEPIGWEAEIDPCPLPLPGAWKWRPRFDYEHAAYRAKQSDCSLWIFKDRLYGWSWTASICLSEHQPGMVVDCSNVNPTRKGAMRAAEKAARRAWRIRAGRKA